jgi:hypothetical protein
MRKFFLLATLLTVLLVILGRVFMLFLSQVRPLRPGNVVFPVQYLAERQRAGLTVKPISRADFELILLEKRITDLMARTGTQHEWPAIRYLDLALNHATEAVARAAAADPESHATLRVRLLTLVQQIRDALAAFQMVPNENADIFQALQAKITTLELILGDVSADLADLSSVSKIEVTPSAGETAAGNVTPTPAQTGLLDPQGIPFPPGSEGAEHLFYPLIGQHTVLECISCHPSEQYAGTPTQCVACHQEVLPLNHFEGDCASCHTPTSWQDATFDHTLYGATDCVACHTVDKPANHFAGQCSACHTTTAWTPANFDHSLVDTSNCQSCHANDAPANHYAGQCSACHNTSNWADASFNHTGMTECASCHSNDAPANHYAGQCSACHNTSNWADASFNHTGMTECASCHSNDAPANHYAGQCSTCHNTSNWADASFNHTGMTECTSCHSNDAPANHYAGQCSTCHNVSNWADASFNHTGQTNCSSCHNPPSDHFPGQCSDCHETNNWDFDHNDGLNCLTCHLDDEPDDEGDHPQGEQCSNCHNTDDWDDVDDDD